MKKHPVTWLEYNQGFIRNEVLADLSQLQAIHQLHTFNQSFLNAFPGCIPALFVLDYTRGSYLTMSNWVKEILINGADYFLDGGIDYTTDIYHKDDLRVFNEQIFSDRLAFLKSIPHDTYENFLFSYNFRLRNKLGQYVNILQRNSFLLPDEMGNPRISLGSIMRVPDYISNNAITSVIEEVGCDNAAGASRLIYKKKYFLHSDDVRFSKRELEVLSCLAEGMTKKKIAAYLHLSEHTVINHKRNMLEKSGCPNSVALVAYALRNKLI